MSPRTWCWYRCKLGFQHVPAEWQKNNATSKNEKRVQTIIQLSIFLTVAEIAVSQN